MKIGDAGSDKTLGEAVVLERSRSRAQSESSTATVSRRSEESEDREAKVNLGLGRLIQGEFDLTKAAADRRKKVEELKELVAAGKYNPDSMEVARAVGEEIALAVLTEGVRFSDE